MWTSIISGLLPVLLKLIGMFFASKAASAEQRESYKEFVHKMSSTASVPARLKSSYEAQLKALQQFEKDEAKKAEKELVTKNYHDQLTQIRNS